MLRVLGHGPGDMTMGSHLRGLLGRCLCILCWWGGWWASGSSRHTPSNCQLGPLCLFTHIPICTLGHSRLLQRIPALGLPQVPLIVWTQSPFISPSSPALSGLLQKIPTLVPPGPTDDQRLGLALMFLRGALESCIGIISPQIHALSL